MQRPPARVLVADDNPSLAGVLAELIADEHGFALAGVATTGKDAVAVAARTEVDVALVDERLDDAHAEAVLQDLRRTSPGTVLLVWSYGDRSTTGGSADGVLDRSMTFREVVRAVRAALRASRPTPAS